MGLSLQVVTEHFCFFPQLAFQENKEICDAVRNFTQILKKNGLTMEGLKYCLEIRKVELKAKMLT